MARSRKPPENYGTLYIRSISHHVKDQFKAYCARRRSTMGAMVEKLMRQCIADDNLEDKPRRKRKGPFSDY